MHLASRSKQSSKLKGIPNSMQYSTSNREKKIISSIPRTTLSYAQTKNKGKRKGIKATSYCSQTSRSVQIDENKNANENSQRNSFIMAGGLARRCLGYQVFWAPGWEPDGLELESLETLTQRVPLKSTHHT